MVNSSEPKHDIAVNDTQAQRKSEVSHVSGALEAVDVLWERLRSQLQHAVDGYNDDLGVYPSLRNLDEVIGTQYGNRVLYELIQNAHDAHEAHDAGEICVHLVLRSQSDGDLYVANRGRGFAWKNVNAIRNIASSSKEIGEGIGNKGLGFRSVEALTSDVQIFSQPRAAAAERFEGFCFRFADTEEVEHHLRGLGIAPEISQRVASTLPRYLASVPITEQPPEVTRFAREAYATVIRLPLRTSNAVALAEQQLRALASLEQPLLLFLERIAAVHLQMSGSVSGDLKQTLRRRQKRLGSCDGGDLYRIDVGEAQKYLLVRRPVDKDVLRNAVIESIPFASQLKRWLNWQGEPVVSVAVPWDSATEVQPRLYNFLPMGDEAAAPFHGYLDAPFFTDIDRRGANLKLPLNDMLVSAAAEACAATALSLTGSSNGLDVPRSAIVDLITWRPAYNAQLDRAFHNAQSTLAGAPVFPLVSGADVAWCGLDMLYTWPERRFAVLKPGKLAKAAGVHLLRADLGNARIDRVAEMAQANGLPLSPSGDRFADWIEAIAANLRASQQTTSSTWAAFYGDVVAAAETFGFSLTCLSGRAIFLDRSGKLQAAGGGAGGDEPPIYYRPFAKRRSRNDKALPPQSLFRRFRILDPRIPVEAETTLAFEKAGLIRRYDDVDALAALASVVGPKASEARRTDALTWAFAVWRSAPSESEPMLRKAGLSVRTRGGWCDAADAVFSGTWTSTGRRLEKYLLEAAPLSPDCASLQSSLLVEFPEWCRAFGDHQRSEWQRFLGIIGVADGLRPVAVDLSRSQSGYYWNALFLHGAPDAGLDSDWCQVAKNVELPQLGSTYHLRGNMWRLPGQIEHAEFSTSAREQLAMLILDYLKEHHDTHFSFTLEKHNRSSVTREVPSALAVFLRTKPWLIGDDGVDVVLRAPSDLWGTTVLRYPPPRLVQRLPTSLTTEICDDARLAALIFGPKIGLGDWAAPASALRRLEAMALTATRLTSAERATFRTQYKRAWADLAEVGTALTGGFPIVVRHRDEHEIVTTTNEAEDLVVADDLTQFQSRLLLEAGRRILEVGDGNVNGVVALLNGTTEFKALAADQVRTQLKVDGEVFEPSATDPTLISQGLEWLPDALLLAHELNYDEFEHGSSASLEQRIRSVRLRRCREFALVIDGVDVSAEQYGAYALPHEKYPTLILTTAQTFTWGLLIETAGAISRLLGRRLRSFQNLLLKLCCRNAPDASVEAPSDIDYARALECDLASVRDQLAAMRGDVQRLVASLLPLMAYFGSKPLATELQDAADRLGARFDVRRWLADHRPASAPQCDALLAACESSNGPHELRRCLDLDFAAFNEALETVGQPRLTAEPELRRLFAAYVQELKPSIVERVRAHYWPAYARGETLDGYVADKELAFIQFDPTWALTTDTLDRETVERRVQECCDERLGAAIGNVSLPPVSDVREKNRRSVQPVVKDATLIIMAWCRKNSLPVPAPWASGDPQQVVRAVENAGLLDFELVPLAQFPSLCMRASCWPTDMPLSLAPDALGLTSDELQAQEQERRETVRRAEIAARSISLGGESLDTEDGGFGQRLLEITEQQLRENPEWLARSRNRVQLDELEDPQASGRSSSSRTSSGRRAHRPTDAQRKGLGLLGEILAYQFLKDKYGSIVDEDCWISCNRSEVFGGKAGDDAAGYDFRVVTPSAEWCYEVKAASDDPCEFELTANEIRVATTMAKGRKHQYRVLYIAYAGDPLRRRLLDLPNPMKERGHKMFLPVGHGSVRFRFSQR